MLPPPPAPGPVDSFGSTTNSAHPRAPADWLADRVDAPSVSAPVADSTAHRKDPSAEEAVLVAAPLRVGGGLGSKKPLLMIGGGVAAVAIVLVIVLSRGGSSKSAGHGGSASAASPIAAGENAGAGSATGDGDRDPTSMKLPAHGGAAATASPSTAADSDEVATASGSAGSAAATVEAPKEPVSESDAAALGSAAGAPPKHHTLGGKQVVLEYDTPTHDAPKAAAPKEDSAAIEKARASYAGGNQKLFAGDPAGAVRAYQQSLAYYPGYVAGYRGLGLAYSMQGDKPKALQAFRTYLSSVPGAKDAALIRKRVTALSH